MIDGQAVRIFLSIVVGTSIAVGGAAGVLAGYLLWG